MGHVVEPPRGERCAGTSREARAVRVLGVIGEPWNGVGYVRFLVPFRHLAAQGFELLTLGRSLTLERGPHGWRPAPSLLDGVSIVLFPQIVAAPRLGDGERVDLVRPICEEARRRGIRVVYSVDDSLGHLDGYNPAFEALRDAADNLEALREHADAILVTTEPLRESLAGWGRPIHVLPNAVDPADWKPRPRASAVPRVGWSGSSSHVDDLRMLVPALRDLQRRVELRFVLQGLVDTTFAEQRRRIRAARRSFTAEQRERAERFEALVRELGSVPHEHVPFGPTAAFFDLLPALDLDVGLCPLRDTPFNRHKSANKFYEYAMTGSMTVASDVVPYSGEVTVTVENEPRAWADAIERFVRDREARETELERQRRHVLSERSIHGWKERWAAALHAILDGEGDGRA